MPEQASRWDWRTVALVSVPVAGLGLGVAYYYFHHRRRAADQLKPPAQQQQQQQVEAEAAEPLQQASQIKERGNKYFRGGRYDKAIECYTEAIEVCPADKQQELATFFQNRAAARESLGQWQQVEADCNEALARSPRYAKALARRAKARERLGDLRGALLDITAVCIIEQFRSADSLARAESVLKARGRELAAQSLQALRPALPSDAFLRTFFQSFSEDPVQLSELGDDAFTPALSNLRDRRFADLLPLCQAALAASANGTAAGDAAVAGDGNGHQQQQDGLSPEETQPPEQQNQQLAADRRDLCSLLLATLQLLSGQPQEASKLLDSLINSSSSSTQVRVNALIKKASLVMQSASPAQAEALSQQVLQFFDSALQLSPDHPDVHHHRGQMLLISDRMQEALNSLNKAAAGAPNNPIPAVQRAYAAHRTGDSSALEELKQLTLKHKTCGEAHSLYAQALLDSQQFQEAEEQFAKVTKLEPDSGTAFVHQGLLRLQAYGDTDGGLRLIRRALEVEPKCEFALETLATIEVQQGNLKEAIQLFDTAIGLTKTEAELSHLWALREAADVQLQLAHDMGLRAPSLAQFQQAL